MLQRIEPRQAELGMFIERLEGNWLTHPFWRRRFVLTETKHLAALHESAVSAVIIDTSRGASPTPGTVAMRRRMPNPPRDPKPVAAAAPTPAPSPAIMAAPRAAPAAPPRAVLPSARQFGNAKRVLRESSKVVSQVFLKARLGQAVRLNDVEGVVDDIYGSISDNPHALNALLRCQRESGEVYRHALAVASLMVALGRAMRLPPDRVRQAGLVGLIMDLGVVTLNEMLPDVEGDYRALPQTYLDQHIYFGHDILAQLGGLPPECLRACLDHHERVDGTGYPAKLADEVIGEFARMAAICDEFDHLVSGGFNTPPLDPHDAVQELLRRWSEFDTALLRTFQRSTGVYPIGTFVNLRTGRLAMVVDIDPEDPDAPIVRTFASWMAPINPRQVTIDLGRCYGSDAIVSVAVPTGMSGPEVQALRARVLEAAHRA